ncbi:lysophospholipid acyltransferase family protein [Gordonia sp. UBA7599]|uniref:lysophospholipid acyltransferase family protein n=1 Tax=Gordonia sp. UBA7599 TaxID=1946578 RepID=UPI0025C52960|nr:lysophospholipid acyltransferase family protein [Gordonia sp. UBA7599]
MVVQVEGTAQVDTTAQVGTAVQHAWYPVASCGPQCIGPARTAAGQVRMALRGARLLVLVLMLACAAPIVWRFAPRYRGRLARRSSRSVLAALGVTLLVDDRRLVDGSEPEAINGLIVANHVSFLDVLAIAAIAPARFVAKSEVLAAPALGAVADRLGVIGIVRESLRELPGTIERVAAALRHGSAVAVFPEGTTWCGGASGRFAPALFTAARAADVSITPMTVEYVEDGMHHCPAAAYIGDDSGLDTLRRVLAVRSMTVTVTVHPVVAPTRDRRADARTAQAVVLGGRRCGHWGTTGPMTVPHGVRRTVRVDPCRHAHADSPSEGRRIR